MNTYHIPILVAEILEGLHIEEGKRYIDATLGGGGHTVAMLTRGAVVLGIDADGDAIAYARERIKEEIPDQREGTDWKLVHGNFRDIEHIARSNGFESVSGILFDLGVSSRQIDSETKGFTYRVLDGPLDMRFDQTTGETARDVLNRLNEDGLYEVFAKFGEEERARPIAHALVRARSVKNIEIAGDVVRVVESVVSDARDRNSVLSRIFQALRIVVNDEQGALRFGLSGAQKLLITGGRLAVISFHSLEDRLVKQFVRSGGWVSIGKRHQRANEEEQMINRRSRSAKLRIAQKI